MAPDCDPDLTGFGRAGCLLQCWQPVGWLMCSTAEGASSSVRLPGMGLALLQSRLVSSQMSPFLFLSMRQGCLDATYDQAPISVLPKNRHFLPSILKAWALLVLGCGVLLQGLVMSCLPHLVLGRAAGHIFMCQCSVLVVDLWPAGQESPCAVAMPVRL